MNEFDLIKHYLATQKKQRHDVVIGIGDDAAIVSIPTGTQLAVTTDTLIAGVHFPLSTSPFDIGYKSLAVNLSDLAAMGAAPAWVTMALTLPQADEAWLQAFCDGFFTLANRCQTQLIGGDLTRGALSITVQAMGLLPAGKAMLRSGAKPDDLIYVTGTLGDAGGALLALQQSLPVDTALAARLNKPEPRLAQGQALLDIATACIDISDGLTADLSHILEASNTGAVIFVDHLPLSQILRQTAGDEKALALALTAGDDYELCFTVSPEKRTALEQRLSSLPCSFTCIGHITAHTGLTLQYSNGNSYHGKTDGYQHF